MKHHLILALPPFIIAATCGLTVLAAGLYADRAGEVAATPAPHASTLDRQFLTSLNAQSQRAVNFAAMDQRLLAAVSAEEMAKVPRATFVAPPRAASPTVTLHTAAPEAESPDREAAIPRATFVAPPSSVPLIAPDGVVSAMPVPQKTSPRRASIVIYEGKTYTTRATVMN